MGEVGPSAAVIPVGRETWTTDTLYLHLAGKIEDLKSSMGDLRQADAKAIQAAFESAETAVNRALASAALAVKVAEDNAEKWRANANEWRGAMDDRGREFAKKDAVDTHFTLLERMILDLNEFKNKSTARNAAYSISMIVVFSIIAVILRFFPT